MKKVILAGGAGFLGGLLAAAFLRRGFEVVVLTRRPRGRADGVPEVAWDGRTCGEWWRELEGAAGIVNLAGKNVNCRYTAAAKEEIVRSRVDSVAALAEAVRRCATKPAIWVQAASAATYGNTGEAVIDEGVEAVAHPGEDPFSHEVCVAWEGAVKDAAVEVKRVILRIGFVLGRGEGALRTMGRLVKCYLGGAAGGGRQWMSWIHHADFVRLVCAMIEEPGKWEGTYLTVSPGAVRNGEFMRELRRMLHRSWGLPAPRSAVPIGCWLMGTEAELALRSRRCVPRRLLREGFVFEYPELRGALEEVYRASERPLSS